MKKITLSFCTTEELAGRLRKMAKNEQRSVSSYLTILIDKATNSKKKAATSK